MKYTSHFPLGIAIPLLACSVPLQAAEYDEQSTSDESTPTAENHEETMVVTAARQNLQAPGVSTITADEIRKHPPPAMCRS
jgi:ferric enterobactin receptor